MNEEEKLKDSNVKKSKSPDDIVGEKGNILFIIIDEEGNMIVDTLFTTLSEAESEAIEQVEIGGCNIKNIFVLSIEVTEKFEFGLVTS